MANINSFTTGSVLKEAARNMNSQIWQRSGEPLELFTVALPFMHFQGPKHSLSPWK